MLLGNPNFLMISLILKHLVSLSEKTTFLEILIVNPSSIQFSGWIFKGSLRHFVYICVIYYESVVLEFLETNFLFKNV